MSCRLRITLGGRQCSGKSTVAAHLALLCASLLELPAAFSMAGKKREAPKNWTHLSKVPERPVVALIHKRDAPSALAYRHVPSLLIRRHQALSPIAAYAAEAAGGVLVGDSVTSWYDQGMRDYVDASNAARERVGKQPHSFLGPDSFREINDAFWRAQAAAQSGPEVSIFVHKEGSEMLMDDDFGLVEGASTRFRGQAESGGNSSLVLLLRGGLRSGAQATGERRLFVAGDGAQMAVGRSAVLPQLRSEEDCRELRRLLWDLLAPSILWGLREGAEEAAAWKDLSEPADIYPGALRSAEKGEVAMLLDQMQTLLAQHRLTGTAAAVQELVRPLLTRAIGWGSLTAAAEGGVSASSLRLGLEILREEAPHVAAALAVGVAPRKPGRNGRAADPAAAPDFSDISPDLG